MEGIYLKISSQIFGGKIKALTFALPFKTGSAVNAGRSLKVGKQ
jgi:hypothetical protein